MKTKLDRLKLYLINFTPLIFVFLVTLYPQSVDVTKNWKDIQFLENSSQQALLIERYQSLVVQQPWQKEIKEKLAELLVQNNRYEEIIEVLGDPDELNTLSAGQQFVLATAYQENQQPDEAAALWKMISQRLDLEPQDYAHLLEQQESTRDWQSAYQTIQRWHQKEPQEIRLSYRTSMYHLIFSPPSAQEILLALLTAKPPYNESAQRLNTALQQLSLEEDRAFQLVLAGKALANEGEWVLASCAFEQATLENPAYAEAWAFLGNAFDYIGLNGFPFLSKAASLNPESTLVQAYQAIYWRNQADFRESITIFTKLALEEPEEAYWRYEIAKTLAQSGDLQSAMAEYKNAIELSPEDGFYRQALITFFLDYHYLVETEGVEAARQALLLAPDDPEINDLMGVIFMRLENYSNAERFLIKANKIQPYSALILYHLGQLYYFQGENNLAYFYLKNAIDYGQNPAIITAANDLLIKIESAN